MTRSVPRALEPDETEDLPRVLYLAVRPHRASGGPMVELRSVAREPRPVVLVYSSLEQFLAGAGPEQPWMLVPSNRLAHFARGEDGYFEWLVMLDVPVPPEARGAAGSPLAEEASWGDDQSADWDYVFVPSRVFSRGDEQALLELQPLESGHLALVAYSSLQSLEASCGPQQPWVPIPAGLLTEARRQSGADTICLDMPLPDHVRHGSEGSSR